MFLAGGGADVHDLPHLVHVNDFHEVHDVRDVRDVHDVHDFHDVHDLSHLVHVHDVHDDYDQRWKNVQACSIACVKCFLSGVKFEPNFTLFCCKSELCRDLALFVIVLKAVHL